MARRRRSLLGNKGPAPTPVASLSPGAEGGAVEEVEPSSEEASEASASEPAEPADSEPAEPEPADPTPEPAPTTPSWVSGDDDDVWDALRAPTPPPISRRGEEIARDSEAAPPANPFAGAGMDAALAGLGDDPFGGFDDFGESPPTEEVPAGVYEDVSTPYSAPMNVPEPPPIPGIVDRFTPPPVQRTAVGAHQTENRPSYLAEPTPAPAPDRRRDFKTQEEKAKAERVDADDDDTERSGPPMLLIGLVLGGALLLVAAIGGGAMMMSGGATEMAGEAPIEAGLKNVEVRNNMRKNPGLIGGNAEEAAAPEEAVTTVDAVPPAEPEGTSEAPEPAPEPEVEAAAAPVPAPAPKPKPKAAPRPPPKPKAAPAPPPVADKGTLKIRSNRRVLVYVNGQAIGYTPQDYKVNPGDYAVSAMVPGQPDTKQTIDAKLSQPGSTSPVDFKF